MLQKRFGQKGHSPHHHHTPQILLSLLPLFLSSAGASVVEETGPPVDAGEAPSVDVGHGLYKLTRPERFDIYAGCFNEGIDHMIVSDLYLIVLQGEGHVDAGELQGGGHGVGK